jgi:hypothetical protein
VVIDWAYAGLTINRLRDEAINIKVRTKAKSFLKHPIITQALNSTLKPIRKSLLTKFSQTFLT